MSTTDTRCTDFEAWAIRENYAFYSERERSVLFYGVSGTRNAIQKAWDAGMSQAATEAAKATGTAGELPPLPEGKLYDTPAGPMHRYTINQMREYGGKCADAARNLAIEQAEAARQPAPVVSSDLRNAAQLIMDLYDDMRMGKESIPAFDALRAALAATAAPVLSDEQIKEAAMQAWPNLPENWWERKGEVWNGAKVFALAILAATNRSQP